MGGQTPLFSQHLLPCVPNSYLVRHFFKKSLLIKILLFCLGLGGEGRASPGNQSGNRWHKSGGSTRLPGHSS